MTERVQILLLQLAGGVAIVAIAAGAAWMSAKGYAVPASIAASVASALVGKLFGQPLAQFTLNHVSKLPPPMAAEAARRAIASLPPEARAQLEQASVVLTGLSSYPPPPPTFESIQIDPKAGKPITDFTTIDIPPKGRSER